MREADEAPTTGAEPQGVTGPGPEHAPGPRPGTKAGRGARVRPGEVGLAVLVGACCLAVNALAVGHLEPLSPDNRGPLALAYHHEHRSLIALPLLLALLVLFPAVRGLGRAALIVLVGATSANITSAVIWRAGVPDYIVVGRVNAVANLSDLIMIVAATVVFVSILWNATIRSRTGRSDLGRRA